MNDTRFMRTAIGLARRGRGSVAPNPSVGCVIVRDGQIVGRGWTQPGGRPHAETEALTRAGEAARGATAYVTLEPCSHHGKTPPCADALIAAGISRVVVATLDPDPRVDGAGVAVLEAAGIEVSVGECRDEAEMATIGFLMRVRDGRPFVTVKIATSLDARIATATGESKWITGPDARAVAHGLRARNDAILVGAGTAVADDPELTCRLPGLADRSPVRVVVDGSLRVPLGHKLVSTARSVPTWVLTGTDADSDNRQALTDAGVELIDVSSSDNGQLDLEEGLRALGERGINNLLVEGGGAVVASLMRADLVDRLIWIRASSVIGGDGLAAVAACGVDVLDGARNFVKVSARPAGPDTVETYERAR